MQKIDGPILRFFAIVSKRTGNLDLYCPLIRNEKVWSSLGANSASIFWKLIQLCGDEFD